MNVPVESSTWIAARIRTELFPRFLKELGNGEIRGETDLLEIFDSLQILRMTVDLERLFHIKISNSELTADNIGTLDRMASFVSRKLPP